MAKRKADSPPDAIVVPIVWVGLDDAEIVLANQILVQAGQYGHEGECTLSFGQVHPPVLLGSLADNRKKIEDLKYVPVKTVAKLAVTPARLREFIQAMETVLASTEAKAPNTTRRKRR
jgi:hypothetical protein